MEETEDEVLEIRGEGRRDSWLIEKYGSTQGFPDGTVGKESACQCRRCKRHRLDLWVGKITWRRKWQPSPVFLPGKSHGQRRLVGYSPWGCRRVGHNLATEHACTICIDIYAEVYTFLI